jgi:tRNA pseudouridine38-40 synthase
MPSRLKLTLSYDGESFDGWQSQTNRNTIQDHLETAFRTIVGKPVRIHGAGRTDAGVHALGQCAHVDLPERRYEPDRWVAALNGLLPPAIRVLRCRFVSQKFHARFSAQGKVYRYRIWNGRVLPPFEHGRVWHVVNALDIDRLVRSAQLFCGEHDFTSFSANRGSPVTEAKRVIHNVRVRKAGPALSFEFEGNGFLYKMVRMMVGATVQSGLHKTSPREILERLAIPRRENVLGRIVAPADGLYLVRIRY